MHSVVFAGFSAESLAGRILDSKPNVVLTASAVRRGAKAIDLKAGLLLISKLPQYLVFKGPSALQLITGNTRPLLVVTNQLSLRKSRSMILEARSTLRVSKGDLLNTLKAYGENLILLKAISLPSGHLRWDHSSPGWTC